MTCSVGYSAFLFVLGDFRARQDLGDACAIPAKRFKGVGEDHHIIGPSSSTQSLPIIQFTNVYWASFACFFDWKIVER